MELSILTQLTVSNELLITQLSFSLFILSESLYSFLSKIHFISTSSFFLKLNKCLFLFIFPLKIFICPQLIQYSAAVHVHIY